MPSYISRAMRYRVRLPEPHSHLFHIEAEIDHPGKEVIVVFPVWTPGSYLLREYARHLEGFGAVQEGKPLVVDRLDKHRFRIRTEGTSILTLRYRVYANELTVRTCHLDGTHGYLNGAAAFPYVPDREKEKCELVVEPPTGWKVSTALPGGPTRFTAENYDELVDSPIEIGTHRILSFTAMGKPHEIAVWGRGILDEGRFADDAKTIVETHGRFFGELPYERYLFIVHLGDKRRGGLEHASSSTLLVNRHHFFPKSEYEETLGLLSHEFFHLWNVKRLRPAVFVPFDYTREQYTRLLWWFEGVTSYYESLSLVRAGLLSTSSYLEGLGRGLTQLERTPGTRKMSLEEASFLAWVKHYRPDENTVNSAVSYYQKGEMVALALDLELRRKGASLDDLLLAVYRKYEGKGVPEDGVERETTVLLGEERASEFYGRYVRGQEPLSPALGLSVVGLRLRSRLAEAFDDKGGTPGKRDLEKPDPGWLGAELSNGAKLVVTAVREGSPAYRAGLYSGDEIVAEGGFRVDRGGLEDRLRERGPQGTLWLTVFRRDELVEVVVPLAALPQDTLWLEQNPEAGELEREAFRSWCGQDWPKEPK